MRSSVRLMAAACVGLVAAGCGPVDPGARVRAAAAATTEESVRFETEVVVESADLPGRLTMRGHGGVDFAADRSTATFDISEFAGLGGDVHMVTQVVVDGDEGYLRPPAYAGEEVWVALTDDERDAMGAMAGSPLGGAHGPHTALEVLADHAVGEVEEAGRDQVRGETTTRYVMTVNMSEAGEALYGEAAQADGEGAEREAVATQVWIDRADRVRRISQRYDLADERGGTVSTTSELFDFGEPVEVTLPPPELVKDRDEAFAHAEESGTHTETLESQLEDEGGAEDFMEDGGATTAPIEEFEGLPFDHAVRHDGEVVHPAYEVTLAHDRPVTLDITVVIDEGVEPGGSLSARVSSEAGRRPVYAAPLDDDAAPGEHVYTFVWDARDNDGQPVHAGRYHLNLSLEHPDEVSTAGAGVLRVTE